MVLTERGGKGLEVGGGRGLGKRKQSLFGLIRRASRERKLREKMGARDPASGKLLPQNFTRPFFSLAVYLT